MENDKSANKQRGRDKDLPAGGEEERRGNSKPTHPDLMGPFPGKEQVQGTVLDKEEQRPSSKGAVRDDPARDRKVQ